VLLCRIVREDLGSFAGFLPRARPPVLRPSTRLDLPSMIDDGSFENSIREWIGEILGRFARGESSVTQDQLIEAVDVELTMNADTVAEILGTGNSRMAELFCTP
jgi:hypothetical protein